MFLYFNNNLLVKKVLLNNKSLLNKFKIPGNQEGNISLLYLKSNQIGSSIFNNRKVIPDKKFMSMFLGFIDGDGYFDIGEQKQYNKKTHSMVKSTIRIRLATNIHTRDLALLEYFVEVLGVGKISKMSKRNQVRLIFFKQDLVGTIIPLIKNYNLEFLTKERQRQYAIVSHILDNNIIQWDELNLNSIDINLYSSNYIYYINLDFFQDWIIGFTIAEGSFGIKKNNSAFYQIRQTGIESYEIIKAICLKIALRKAYLIKPDSSNSYQLSLSSVKDIQCVIDFFSSPSNYPLIGYKRIQYEEWLIKLLKIKRYERIRMPIK